MITKERRDELELLLKPVVKFMCEMVDSFDPHHKIIIDCTGAVVLSGECGFKIEEYILD